MFGIFNIVFIKESRKKYLLPKNNMKQDNNFNAPNKSAY